MSSSIFAIVTNDQSIRTSKFFSTKEKAKSVLKDMLEERRYKMGVQCIQESENGFSYIFGWEEHKVVFSIVEIDVQ